MIEFCFVFVKTLTGRTVIFTSLESSYIIRKEATERNNAKILLKYRLFGAVPYISGAKEFVEGVRLTKSISGISRHSNCSSKPQ